MINVKKVSLLAFLGSVVCASAVLAMEAAAEDSLEIMRARVNRRAQALSKSLPVISDERFTKIFLGDPKLPVKPNDDSCHPLTGEFLEGLHRRLKAIEYEDTSEEVEQLKAYARMPEPSDELGRERYDTLTKVLRDAATKDKRAAKLPAWTGVDETPETDAFSALLAPLEAMWSAFGGKNQAPQNPKEKGCAQQ